MFDPARLRVVLGKADSGAAEHRKLTVDDQNRIARRALIDADQQIGACGGWRQAVGWHGSGGTVCVRGTLNKLSLRATGSGGWNCTWTMNLTGGAWYVRRPRTLARGSAGMRG